MAGSSSRAACLSEAASEITLLRQKLLDFVIEAVVGEDIVDVEATGFGAWSSSGHGQGIVDVLVAAIVRVAVCPLREVVRPRLRVPNCVSAIVAIPLGLHLDVELGEAREQRGDVLVRLAQLLLVLRVLRLVGSQLPVALQLDPFVL